MTTTERPRQQDIDAFSSRRLAPWRVKPAQQTPPEETYHLPNGVSGSMKELLHDPMQATRSIRGAQTVMNALYDITNVDSSSRETIAKNTLKNRMAIVRDIFKPDSRETLEQAENKAASMIKTAATIYNRGRSDLPLRK
ncbi:MAG: hypothetical protein H0W89_06605 [Candidatus Levybacteria bacterium]|nr:hypothetical protein [Candidatus Levybacteria bacterium]